MINVAELRNVVQRIADRFDPEKIILFGSYAHGVANEQSDLDLLVVARTNLPIRDRFKTIRRLLADFPIAVDVYLKTPDEFERWRSVVNHVVYWADKYGKVVYERSSAGSGSALDTEAAQLGASASFMSFLAERSKEPGSLSLDDVERRLNP